ncbi:hypothetical protein Pfo_023957 [Paulownia fortunei]|nr:hypothetical protein Pfo_023957 [Paulownia fortunei]
MSTHRPTLWGVFSDASRIISAHPRHFLALSVLFILPVSFLTIIYPFLFQPTSVHSHYHRSLFFVSTADPEIPPVAQLLIPILYALCVLLFSLCSSASITHSTFRGFYGRPVRFITSLKSILVSFFPLLATLLVTQIILGLIVFAFGIFVLLAYNGLALFGFKMDYDSQYFLFFVILIAALLVGLLVYLQVGWCLTTTVVIVESDWGFAPLKRSWYLVKGMRGVAFLMILFFGILVGLLTRWYSSLVANAGGIIEGWSGWGVVLQMVVYACLTTILSLYTVAANTVLFIYCKALHGEWAPFQSDEEMGREYVRLPFDDGVAPFVVNVV